MCVRVCGGNEVWVRVGRQPAPCRVFRGHASNQPHSFSLCYEYAHSSTEVIFRRCGCATSTPAGPSLLSPSPVPSFCVIRLCPRQTNLPYSTHLVRSTPRIPATGMFINCHSDGILRRLRGPQETGYKIPRGEVGDGKGKKADIASFPKRRLLYRRCHTPVQVPTAILSVSAYMQEFLAAQAGRITHVDCPPA